MFTLVRVCVRVCGSWAAHRIEVGSQLCERMNRVRRRHLDVMIIQWLLPDVHHRRSRLSLLVTHTLHTPGMCGVCPALPSRVRHKQTNATTLSVDVNA